MQIEIKDENGNIVIVNDQCYVYTLQGDQDVYIEWADLTPQQKAHAVDIIGVADHCNSDVFIT